MEVNAAEFPRLRKLGIVCRVDKSFNLRKAVHSFIKMTMAPNTNTK